MTSKDFVDNYNMHDSLIDSVEISKETGKIVLTIDFAFWMQPGYSDSDPETGLIKVTFSNVSYYAYPDEINLDQVSILETSIESGNVKFALIDDITDDSYEILIESDFVEIEY